LHRKQHSNLFRHNVKDEENLKKTLIPGCSGATESAVLGGVHRRSVGNVKNFYASSQSSKLERFCLKLLSVW
jgi:hypothetical protein